MFSSSLFVLLGLAAGGVLARPTAVFPPEARDVIAPPITYPKEGTVWTVGESTHVDWDVSHLPPYDHITNPTGMVVLGYLDPCSDGEHLDLDHPLADDFNITLGTIPVTVPNVVARSDYILVLFGDSGNMSPKFTINLAISGADGQAPPVRAVCTTSTASSTSPSSTTVHTSTPDHSGTSSASSDSSSSPDSVSAASATTDTTIVIVPTSTESAAASSTASSTPSTVSPSKIPSTVSGSTVPLRTPASPSAPSPSPSQTGTAAQSQSTSGAASSAAGRLVAVLSGLVAAGYLLL